MKLVIGFALFLVIQAFYALGQHDCNDFTFSECNIEDNIVWENDQVGVLFFASQDMF